MTIDSNDSNLILLISVDLSTPLALLDTLTSETAAAGDHKGIRTQLKETTGFYKKINESAELLSYNLRDNGIQMDPIGLVDDLHRFTFCSIANNIMNNIMNLPFFLGLVLIGKDEDEEGDAKYN